MSRFGKKASSQTGSKGGKKDFNFITVGSVNLPKTIIEKAANDDNFAAVLEDVLLALEENEIRFNFSFYQKEGTMEFNNDTNVLLSFKHDEKKPNFVVGKALIPKN